MVTQDSTGNRVVEEELEQYEELDTLLDGLEGGDLL